MQRSLIAIIISIIGIILLLKINLNIAQVHAASGTKPHALFWVIQFGFVYKYLAGAFGGIAIILTLLAYRNHENKYWLVTAAAFSIFAFAITFLKLWKALAWILTTSSAL